QAEDGIRDRNVTGVQTCALPICVPDPRERVRGEAGNVLAVDDVATGGRRVEAPEEVHEGGLPGTRRSHHRDELTVLDRHRDPAERVDRVRPQVVVLRQAFGGDDRSGHDYSLRRGPLCGWGAPRTAPPARPTMTSWPSFRSPRRISVKVPSLRPS